MKPEGGGVFFYHFFIITFLPEGGGVAKVCRAFGLQQPLVWAGEEIKVEVEKQNL